MNGLETHGCVSFNGDMIVDVVNMVLQLRGGGLSSLCVHSVLIFTYVLKIVSYSACFPVYDLCLTRLVIVSWWRMVFVY